MIIHKIVARKKKKAERPKRQIVEAWDEWKVGDLVWVKTYPIGKIVYGEIQEFHPTDSIGPAVTILDQVIGCYRTVLCAGMYEKDPRKNKIKIRSRK